MESRGRTVFVAGLVVAGCMVSARAAWAVDPCSLLTPGEAASALGVPEVNAGAAVNRCTWTSKKYVRGAGTLTVQMEGAKDGAKMMNQGTPLSGVGDEAIQTVVPGANSAVLHVRKGSTWFVMNVHGVALDQAEKVERAVAQEMIAKM